MRKTAIARTKKSIPVTFWEETGEVNKFFYVLDFGCGKDVHTYYRYDPITCPEYGLIGSSWDVVMCNYVLNVIKEDWLIHQTIALVGKLADLPKSKALFAIRNDLKESTDSQTVKPIYEWEEILNEHFNNVDLVNDSTFIGFVCK